MCVPFYISSGKSLLMRKKNLLHLYSLSKERVIKLIMASNKSETDTFSSSFLKRAQGLRRRQSNHQSSSQESAYQSVGQETTTTPNTQSVLCAVQRSTNPYASENPDSDDVLTLTLFDDANQKTYNHTRSLRQEDLVKNERCYICYFNFELGEWVTELPCQHIYHFTDKCKGINEWLKNHKQCPYCRTPI